MLKIKDSTGDTIGTLQDEDSAPEMKKKAEEAKGETKDATVGRVEQVGGDSAPEEEGTGDRSSQMPEV